jgi:HAD superfamily hydrolase (TIGR01509 family)
MQQVYRGRPSFDKTGSHFCRTGSGQERMNEFDLVIFDCDGVLIDSEIISARMLVAELARLGLQIDLSYVERHFLGRSYPVVMDTIRREFGLDLPDAFEAQYREALLAAFRQDLRVVPHVPEVLAAMGVPFCVATSSSPRRAEMSLALVGLSGCVAGRLFTSTMVARGKPAPDLFLHAAARMGAAPARTLVIEDTLTGIRAGLAAGMTVWRFVGGSHLGPDTPLEPEDARPHRRLVAFSQFFQIAPTLKQDPQTA